MQGGQGVRRDPGEREGEGEGRKIIDRDIAKKRLSRKFILRRFPDSERVTVNLPKDGVRGSLGC